MAYRLDKSWIEHAIDHLAKFGDTDIFPRLPEIAFFEASKDAVATELENLDLDTYNPKGAIESLAPKSRYGFRIAHQLDAIDTILFLATVLQIASAIERRRLPSPRAFSYRIQPVEDGQVFQSDQTFRKWLNLHKGIAEELLGEFEYVVITDISDFYHRVNFHRLENYLDECAPSHGAAKFIKKYIKKVRARQSYGLPVGGTAARILAELVLSDADEMLAEIEVEATRFVDDFRIFIKRDEDPYDILAQLAEQLAITEGLSLNVAKTRVLTIEEFCEEVNADLADVSKSAEEQALETLTAELYFDDEPDPRDIERLGNMNLLGRLIEELEHEHWDVGRIKVLFRALRITKHEHSAEFVKEHFERFIVFAKELVLLMEALAADADGLFDDLTDRIIEAILSPPAASVQLIQCWLLELFVRGVVPIRSNQIRRLEAVTEPLLRRQLILIRGRNKDRAYFRRQKTAVDQFTDAEKFALICGAACLPEDEFRTWAASLRTSLNTPTSQSFLAWATQNRETAIDRITGTFETDAFPDQ